MEIYFIVFFSLVFFSIVFDFKKNEIIETRYFIYSKNFILFIIFISFSLIIGLRYQIGPDWFSYKYYYDLMKTLSFYEVLQMKDFGYQIINYLSYHSDFGMVGVNLTCGIIFSFALLKFSNNQSSTFISLIISFPYLFLVVSMGYSRQAIAISFFLLAIISLSNDNVRGYVLLVLFGSIFHKTAIVMIPLAFIVTERPTYQKVFFCSLFVYFIIYLFMTNTFDAMIYTYIESNRYTSPGALMRVILCVIPSIIFILFKSRFNYTKPIYNLTYLLSISSLLLLFCLVFLPNLSTMIDRFSIYLIPIQILVFANLFNIFEYWDKFFVITLTYLYYFIVLFSWLFFGSHASSWIPYDSYL
ncbi:hypothetical protein PMAL9190_03397 [Photobacterium malacitanum]|uniref:Transmembrane protein EpsG n=1 Tax=Photobacterium malacitanum TaxID=2204294 RepID=A0A1Y6MNL6_9GAMM|nr:hypothetical protein PMAL9190_03397 [Photobacterium malacitanum]